jgi:hypothetical protein
MRLFEKPSNQYFPGECSVQYNLTGENSFPRVNKNLMRGKENKGQKKQRIQESGDRRTEHGA